MPNNVMGPYPLPYRKGGRGDASQRTVTAGPVTGSAQGAGQASAQQASARQAQSAQQTQTFGAPDYSALMERYISQMETARDQAAAAQDARTGAAVAALEGNRYSIEQNAEAAARQAYVSKMLAEKRLPQQLRATGSSGGMTDSAVLRMNADYENSRNSIQNARYQAINDLESQIAQAEAQGEAALGQQQSEWARQLAQMRYALGLEQEKAARQTEPVRQAEPTAASPVMPSGPSLDDYDAAKRLSEQFGRSPTTQEMARVVYSLAAQGVPDEQIDAYLTALGFDPRQFQ